MEHGFQPPLLVRDEYYIWKFRMENYLKFCDYKFWKSVTHGPYVPMTVPDDGGVSIPKEKTNYTEEEKKRVHVDLKAKALLVMALPNEIFRRHLHCESAKELWDGLCNEFENPYALARRAKLLIPQYELFAYNTGESITEQFIRFMSLVVELKDCRVIYENEDMLIKFMRSLPSHWKMYTMVIRQTSDLTKMTLDDLHHKLRIYELEMIWKAERLNMVNGTSQGRRFTGEEF